MRDKTEDPDLLAGSSASASLASAGAGEVWKVLLVDDEPDVHAVLRLHVDPHDAPRRSRRAIAPSADTERAVAVFQRRGDGPGCRTIIGGVTTFAVNIGQPCAAQTPARAKIGNRFQKVRLARLVLADEHRDVWLDVDLAGVEDVLVGTNSEGLQSHDRLLLGRLDCPLGV